MNTDTPDDMNGLEVSVESQATEYWSINPREPDPEWSHVDQQGHEHRWVDGEVPTLESVVVETWWCPDCRAEHVESEMRCKDCGEPVEAGTRPAPNPQYAQGPAQIRGTVTRASPHYERIAGTIHDGSRTTVESRSFRLVGATAVEINPDGAVKFYASDFQIRYAEDGDGE